jgi:hypothetical protein
MSDSDSDLAGLLPSTAYQLLLDTTDPSSATRRLGAAADWLVQIRLTLNDFCLPPEHSATLGNLYHQVKATQAACEALGALLAGTEQ